MKKTAIKAGIIVALITALTACGSSETTKDDGVRFGEDGNMYMPPNLCRNPNAEVSDETRAKMKQWFEDVKAGKANGEIICEPDK